MEDAVGKLQNGTSYENDLSLCSNSPIPNSALTWVLGIKKLGERHTVKTLLPVSKSQWRTTTVCFDA
jgi:hypothetical protein